MTARARRAGAALAGTVRAGLERIGLPPLPPRPAQDTSAATPEEAAAPAASPAVSNHSGPEDTVLYAIGDIHGRADLIERLFGLIEEDSAGEDLPGQLIFLGDYVDRGLQSRQVIDFLLGERVQQMQPVYLKGNHEEAMLDFLSHAESGPEWAKYGGRETLVSYGVRPPRSLTFNEEWEVAHEQFRELLPESHETFLLNLQLSARFGEFGFVHAGVRPGRSFEEQSPEDLLWIRDEFLKSNHKLDLTVVHGHTPVDEPTNSHRKVNVDTGAYYSGRLTAAKICRQEISFLSTQI